MTVHDKLTEINGAKPSVFLEVGRFREVKSQSSNTTYRITRHPGSFHCTCPAWKYQKGQGIVRTCKHLETLLGEKYERERMRAGNPGVESASKGKTTANQARKPKQANTRDVQGGAKRNAIKLEEDDGTDEYEVKGAKTAPSMMEKKRKVDAAENVAYPEYDTLDSEELRAEMARLAKRIKMIEVLIHAAPKQKDTKVTMSGSRKKTAGSSQTTDANVVEDIHNNTGEMDMQPLRSKLDPPLLLAEKWDLEKGVDPTGYWMSEKLDGVRAFWDGLQLQSRNGNKFSAPDWFITKFPKQVTLDGELTCGRGKFSETLSIVKQRNAPDTWKSSLRFHVFDVPSKGNLPFEKRQEVLKNLVAEIKIDWLIYVKQKRVKDKDQVIKELEKVTHGEGEGLMLRQPGSKYIGNRSKTCLKVKKFMDAEAPVVGHTKGKGKCENQCGALLCMTDNGRKFKVGSGLTSAMRQDPPEVGTVITYRYFELTKNGVPRHPSFLRIFQGY